MMFIVYILQSEKDNSYYVGYTSNIDVRLSFHNEGLSQYTSAKRPWRVAYQESFESKSEAIKREKFIKRQKSRQYIESLIVNI